ncbi:MAG: hypothetical protein KAQ83_03040 [Nanoarchaeota archaeon]|nr:hypothetical protein [Nanoarchaeota archaeon]
MKKEIAIKLFQDNKVRVKWAPEKEEWYFSIIDVIAILTDNTFQSARNYWKVLKFRLKEEGNESVTNCNQLKLQSSDEKYYLTDVADTEQLLRLIQSIPSKKAEPFKIWLAKVGYERIEETEDPEKAFDRAMATYLKKGYSKEWINQRLKSIEIRKELTNEWSDRDINNPSDFATLTNELTEAWSGKSVKEYKKFKDLKKENLRDNMTNLELVLNMLAETTTTEITKTEDSQGFKECNDSVKKGGKIVGNTRKEIEKTLKKPIITSKNAKELHFNNKKKLK